MNELINGKCYLFIFVIVLCQKAGNVITSGPRYPLPCIEQKCSSQTAQCKHKDPNTARWLLTGMDLALEVDFQSIRTACSNVHGWHVSSLNWLPNWRDKFYNLRKLFGQFLVPVHNVRILMLKNKNRSFIVMLVSDYTLIMCKRYNKLIHSRELSIMWQWIFFSLSLI